MPDFGDLLFPYDETEYRPHDLEQTLQNPIEVVIPDDQLDNTIEAIINAAKTGKIGDGKIFVSTVEQAIRIRTSEEGPDAL